ncbi:MAG: reductase [Anaerocolumna sp.]|jgi:nucleoside-diphosphate-sugar epimerase|nr:reductase [Anaerocolumna sp.]
MNILVLGGTRFAGVHLVNALLDNGHQVTIATRGITQDNFGNKVKRIKLDRTSKESLTKELSNSTYDVICDSLAYCSNDVKYLLDVVSCNRYVMISTMSVYHNLHPNIREEEFDPLDYSLKWCDRADYPYDEVKRQAECALFKEYPNQSSVAVRFPFIIGEDDYTKRLYFYVEHVMKGIPMYINNLHSQMAFIQSIEAGNFLAFLVKHSFTGCINGCSHGTISIHEIINYVEKKANVKAIYSMDGDTAPYNHADDYSLSTIRGEELGFKFQDLKNWIYELLDYYIEVASN